MDARTNRILMYRAPEYVAEALAGVGAWVLAVCVLGYVLGLTSVAGWTGLAVLSLVPSVIAALMWSAPSASLSESIRDVLR